MLKSALKNLTLIDNFGKPVRLTINSSTTLKTPVGAVVTLTIFAIFLSLLIGQILNISKQNSPQTITSILYNEKPQLTNLSFAQNPIMFGLQYRNATFFKNNSIYTVDFEQCEKGENGQFSCSNIPLVDCNLTYYENTDWYKFYSNLYQLPIQYCPDYEWYSNNYLQLQGSYDNESWKYLQIQFQVCDKSKKNNNCASDEEISQQIDGGFFSIDMFNHATNLKQKGNPYTNIGLDEGFFLSGTDFQQYVFMFYEQIETITDQGLILTDEVSTESMQFENSKNFLSSKNGNVFLTVQISFRHKKILNYRSYTKLQQVLGSLGGLWWIFQTLAQMILTPISSFIFYYKLAQKQYSFQKSTINIQTPKNQSQSNNKLGDFQIINKHQDQIINKTLKQKLNKLSLTFYDYLINKYNENHNEVVQFKQVRRKIKKQLDIQNILMKLQELENLKLVILDQNQLTLFDFLSKPQIPHINERQQNNNDGQQFKNQFGEINKQNIIFRDKQGLKSFTEIQQKHKKSAIDNRLLNMMDYTIQQMYIQRSSGNLELDNISKFNCQTIQSEIDERFVTPQLPDISRMNYNLR